MTRSEAKEILQAVKFLLPTEAYSDMAEEALNMAIEALERKHGEWIKMDRRGKNVQCSKCGNTLDLRGVNAGRGDANFCPNCGADMRGEEDEIQGKK